MDLKNLLLALHIPRMMVFPNVFLELSLRAAKQKDSVSSCHRARIIEFSAAQMY